MLKSESKHVVVDLDYIHLKWTLETCIPVVHKRPYGPLETFLSVHVWMQHHLVNHWLFKPLNYPKFDTGPGDFR